MLEDDYIKLQKLPDGTAILHIPESLSLDFDYAFSYLVERQTDTETHTIFRVEDPKELAGEIKELMDDEADFYFAEVYLTLIAGYDPSALAALEIKPVTLH